MLLPVEVSLRAPIGHQSSRGAQPMLAAWMRAGVGQALGAPALSAPLLHQLPELLVADAALGPQQG